MAPGNFLAKNFLPERRAKIASWAERRLERAQQDTLGALVPDCFEQYVGFPNPETPGLPLPLWEGHCGGFGERIFAVLDSFSPDDVYLSSWWEGLNRYDDIDREKTVSIRSNVGGVNFIFFSDRHQMQDHLAQMAIEHSDNYGSWFGAECPEAIWPVSQQWFMAFPYNYCYSFVGGSSEMISAIESAIPGTFLISLDQEIPHPGRTTV